MFKNKRSFTLVEILIVMAIVVILLTTAVATLNPKAMIVRAHDSRRKRDLARIKVAFEDYFNDKGCYPTQNMVNELMDNNHCFSSVFSPWMKKWLCDPSGQPYYIFVDSEENPTCPKWFEILTNLGNKTDIDIPSNWYGGNFRYLGDGSLGAEDVNYGVSSSNVFWYQQDYPDACDLDTCYLVNPETGACLQAVGNHCSGNYCYYGHDETCTVMCKTSCCGSDCY